MPPSACKKKHDATGLSWIGTTAAVPSVPLPLHPLRPDAPSSFYSSRDRHHRVLRSFPTRRSSDLRHVRLAEIAGTAGVSKATASRALRDPESVSAASRAKVQQALA